MLDLRRRSLCVIWSVAVVMVCASVVGCKPTAEGEAKAFARYKTSAAEYSAKWPGFKSVVDATLSAATTKMEAAKKVSGEEKKGAAMKAANEPLKNLTGKLGEVKYKSEALEKVVTKLNKLRLGKSKHKERKRGVKRANDTLREVTEAMSAAKPADLAAAMTILKEQVSKLISAKGSADRLHRKLGGVKSKKKKKKKK